MYVVVILICRISCFQYGGSFQLNPLVTTGRLSILCRIVTNQIRRCKQIALEFKFTYSLFHYYHDLNMNKSCVFKVQRLKPPFSFWTESVLQVIFITMISITGHTVKNNHRSRDPKGPIGNAYLAIHINEILV